MDHITHNLWLGGQHDADALIRKNPEGISAILNVRGRDGYYPPGRDQSAEHPGKAYKWIPAPDTGFISHEQIVEASTWLQEESDKQHRILIHCKHGISRSPAFLAAFMVHGGISPNLEDAIATIKLRRAVQPAIPVTPRPQQVVTVSAITGLPNQQAFDRGQASAFAALVDVHLMRVFNDSYGPIAGDLALRRLGRILISVGLDAYHSGADKFLCKASSSEELSAKLAQARRAFRECYQVYADGRIRTIEGMDFSFGVGITTRDAGAELQAAKKSRPDASATPEWLRSVVESAGYR